MQFWPRKRSRHSIARIRSWTNESKVKILGFIGYKAGMTHLMAVDNRPKSITKGERISIPSTIIECPPMTVAGVVFYQKHGTGVRKSTSILAPKLPKELGNTFPLPKKAVKSFDAVKEFEDLRLLVFSNPKSANTGSKVPKVLEMALGGSKDDKLAYAKEILGKEIKVEDVFEKGNPTDIHGITKGKGFQGTVKRYGVPIRQHKAEKTKRGIGNLGSWTPKRVDYRVAQGGKMGFHSRTEYNKQILKVGQNGEDVNPQSGIPHYGLVNNSYLLIRGSVVGPVKRPIVLTQATRIKKKTLKEAPEIKLISK